MSRWTFRHRPVLQLTWTLILRELRSRYKVTYLGFFWSLLRPILFAAVLWVVGKKIIRVETSYSMDYGPFLIVGLLPWTFLAAALTDSSQTFVQNASLIRKVYFPRVVFPLATVGSNLVNFLLGVLAILGPLIVFGVIPLSPTMLLFPIVLAVHFLLVLSLSLIVSISNVFFRDTTMIVEFALQAWFYLTPIFYPISYALESEDLASIGLARLYPIINPMAPIIHAYRRSILGGVPRTAPFSWDALALSGYLGISFLWGVVLLYIAVRLYRKHRGAIADEV